MSKANRIAAKKSRTRLLSALGDRCVACKSREQLTFDCIEPAKDNHSDLGQAEKMKYYWEHARRGNLQILCHACNSLKGGLSAAEWSTAMCKLGYKLSLLFHPLNPALGRSITTQLLRELIADSVSEVARERLYKSYLPLERSRDLP